MVESLNTFPLRSDDRSAPSEVDWDHQTSSRPRHRDLVAITMAAEIRRAVMAMASSFSAANIYAPAGRHCAEFAQGCAAISSSARPTAASAALQRLRVFRDWSDNWDAEGAPAPDPAAIDAASNLLGFLKSYPVEPTAMLHASGLPMLLVNYGGGAGEITISAQGGVDFVLDLPNGDTEAEVDLPFDNLDLPPELHAVLSKLKQIVWHER